MMILILILQGAAQSDVLKWWRLEVAEQANLFAEMHKRAKELYNITVRVFYRTSPPSGDIWIRKKGRAKSWVVGSKAEPRPLPNVPMASAETISEAYVNRSVARLPPTSTVHHTVLFKIADPTFCGSAVRYMFPGNENGNEYSHNILGAINDMSTAAYLAAGQHPLRPIFDLPMPHPMFTATTYICRSKNTHACGKRTEMWCSIAC